MEEIYTYEICKDLALKCETRKELFNKNRHIHAKIYRENWVELLSHMRRLASSYFRTIYAYEFKELNSVYVGLTYDIKVRNKDHHIKGTLYDFTKEHNIDSFEPIVLEENIKYDKAGEVEDFYINQYRKNGWNLINKAKAGSLGGNILKNEVIVCFNSNGDIVHKDKIEYFAENNFCKLSLIRRCLRKQCNSTNGYRFMYEEEWECMGKPQNIGRLVLPNAVKKLALLDKQFNLIATFDTKKEARIKLGYSSPNCNIYKFEENEITTVKRTMFLCYYDDYVDYLNGLFEIVKPTIPKCKKRFFISKNSTDKISEANKMANNIKQYIINQRLRQRKKRKNQPA